MSKDWLIRTQSKQILGPVSREKIVELLEKNMLQEDDELCSGNGYWFFVKESNLIERYVKDCTVQPFNPISEAKDVLNKNDKGTDHAGSSTDSTLVMKAPVKNKKAPIPEPEKVELPEEENHDSEDQKKNRNRN